MKNRILRYKLMELHLTYVKSCQYEKAKIILDLLRRGRIRLGLGDVAWAVERDLEELGCAIHYSRHGYGATVYSRARG